jgi:hypothetical protein
MTKQRFVAGITTTLDRDALGQIKREATHGQTNYEFDIQRVPARALPVDPSHAGRGVLLVTRGDRPRSAARC